MKGQGSVLQVMVGVLVVSVLLLFLFVVRVNTTEESISALGQTSQSFRARLVLTNLDSLSFRTVSGRKMQVGEAVSYVCSQSEGMGPDFLNVENVRALMRDYLDSQFGEGNYVLEMENCFLSINTGNLDTLQGEKRVGTSYLLQLADGNTARVILYL